MESNNVTDAAPRVRSFEAMNLKEPLMRGLLSYGYKQPSPIQQRLIPPIVVKRDCIAQAASGTGKTAAISIAVLQVVDDAIRETQAIVLSPTRELALQTQTLCASIGQFMAISAHACVGGHALQEDVRRLEAGVTVVSGTPGRVLDVIRKRHLRTASVRLLILDEADEMLGKGLRDQIQDIYRYLPPLQVVVLSATMPGDVLKLTENFMVDPLRILVERDEVTVDAIRQFYLDVNQEENKLDCLKDIFESLTIAQSVVFCNTKKKVEWLSRKLTASKFSVASMHGDMSQADRDSVMKGFRDGSSRVLVTTDVWSRGIDIEQVSCIVNYDLPTARELYLHRIGRTGRFGRTGVAITLVKREELRILKDIEQYFSTVIHELPEDIDV